MRIHVLQHVAFEGPGFIDTWARERNGLVRKTSFFQSEALPSAMEFDLLVILGGPMNIYEHDLYPWLAKEKEFIEKAVRDNKKLLGICLGAQLIADVLGGKVVKSPQKEIGWFPVELTPEAERISLFKTIPKKFMAFHWHGDMFTIPPGSVNIAQSMGCPNQAFFFENRVLGLQFHLESTEASIRELLQHAGHELAHDPYIQDEQTILLGMGAAGEAHRLMSLILEQFERDVHQAGRLAVHDKKL